MSADLLRRAAEKPREHALALPGAMTGQWFSLPTEVVADDGTDVGMLVLDAYNPKEDGRLVEIKGVWRQPAPAEPFWVGV